MSRVPNDDEEVPAAIAGADWLCLAASPVFAAMALLTETGGGAEMICSSGMQSWPISGMALMYLLMSAFHSAPWIRLISKRCHG